MLRKLFYRIIDLGVDESFSPLDNRRIRTINLFNLIAILFFTLGATDYFVIDRKFPGWIGVFLVFYITLSTGFNLLKKSISSFVLFSIGINGTIFFLNQYFPVETGSYLYYYCLIISVVLLNNPTRIDKFVVLHFAICLLFFIAHLTVRIPELSADSLTPQEIKITWWYNVVISASVTAVLSALLTRLIFSQNREIAIQNKSLVKTKEAVDASLREKEVLLAELHHRVKNNLAIITGLLNLQEDASCNEEVKQALGDSKARIMSMALVHKMLYENPDLKNINAGKYAVELVSELLNSYSLLKKVSISCDCDDIILPVGKSIPLGLILNEIVTNSIKYVYRSSNNDSGLFFISVKTKGSLVNLTVRDNGPGFPADFHTIANNSPSLGIYLIKTLAEQIDAEVSFLNDNGAKITISFSAS